MLRARDGEGVFTDRAVQRGARRDSGAIGNLDRRDKLRVGPHEDMIADDGLMFFRAVIVAGDHAGADIGLFAYRGVADIAQVAGLAARSYRRLFNFNKIPDPHIVSQRRIRAQARKRADAATGADDGLVDQGIGQDLHIIANQRVLEITVGRDAHIVAEPDPPLDDDVNINLNIPPRPKLAAQIKAGRIGEAQAVQHQAARLIGLKMTLGLRQLQAVIDAQGFNSGFGDDRLDRHPIRDRARDNIGQVIFTLFVVIIQRVQPAVQPFGPDRHQTGVHLANAAFGGAGIAGLHDGRNAIVRITDNPAIGAGLLKFSR